MSSQYYAVMLLFLIGFAIAMRMGWLLATNHWDKYMTQELRAEAVEHFRKEYYDLFVKKFEEQVEARANEIASAFLEDLEKEKNDGKTD